MSGGGERRGEGKCPGGESPDTVCMDSHARVRNH